MTQSEDYELFGRGALQDPYPLLHQLRDEDPVHWSEPLQAWVFTRYDDVMALLRDPRAKNDRTDAYFCQLPEEMRQKTGGFERHVRNWLGMIDPPKHTRLRELITRAFTPRIVRALQPRIQQLCRDLLDRAQSLSDTPDLKAELADRIPATVICEMLELPTDRHDDFREWVYALLEGVEKTGPALHAGIGIALPAFEKIKAFMMPIIIIMLMVTGANRDPERFSDPDRFDITRTDNKHVSLGWGDHFCLGAPLARAEANITFDILAERFPDMQLALETPVWRVNQNVRMLKSLPVKLS